MRLEANSALVDRIDLRETNRLESARVGQHCPLESHESRDPAHLAHQLRTRTKRQMVRVGKHQPISHRPQLIRRHRLYRGASPNRHEYRRRNFAMGSLEESRTRSAVARGHREFDWRIHDLRIRESASRPPAYE